MKKYLQILMVLCFKIAIVKTSAYSNNGYPFNGGDRMLHQRWATSQGPFWNEQQWRVGDFNGDGKDDLVNVFGERGKICIDVHFAGNGGFNPQQRWLTGSGRFWNEQQWRVGDFNGDGKDDLAKIFEDDGKACIDVYFAGNGGFNPQQRWLTSSDRFLNEQQWRVGDFNGDGKDDLAKAFEDNGKACIDVYLARNGEFNQQRWLTGSGRFWNEQQWRAGDFNGDGKDDLVNVSEESGRISIDVYLAGNGGLNPQQRWLTGPDRFQNEQQWRVGDFNDDGKDDLAKAFEDDGKACIDVYLSRNGEFDPQRWATGPGRFWNEQQWRVGDFNGDGKDDLAKVFEERNKANIEVHLSTN